MPEPCVFFERKEEKVSSRLFCCKPKRYRKIKYYLNIYTDRKGKKEIEIDMENQTVTLRDLRQIISIEFKNKRQDKLFFHSENTLLVVGEVDWLEEAGRIQ